MDAANSPYKAPKRRSEPLCAMGKVNAFLEGLRGWKREIWLFSHFSLRHSERATGYGVRHTTIERSRV